MKGGAIASFYQCAGQNAMKLKNLFSFIAVSNQPVKVFIGSA